MYAKFPFYSVAQMYAISIDAPVSILLGRDNLYWVVDKGTAYEYIRQGFSQMNCSN